MVNEISEESDGARTSFDAIFTPPASPPLLQFPDSHTPISARPQKKHITFLNGLALVISLQIGSGIFAAPSHIANYIDSPLLAISVWLVGGSLAYFGAMAFVELGIALPHNGGIQEYLRYAYSDFYGCLFTWTWLCIAKPPAMAIISMVFADYLCRACLPELWNTASVEKIVAIVGLLTITLINCFGIRSGIMVANGFLVLKLFTLFSIIFIGIRYVFLHGTTGIDSDPGGWFAHKDQVAQRSWWESTGHYTTAVYGTLFCYGGWESVRESCSAHPLETKESAQIGFVAGEMQNPARDLPKIINVAMFGVVSGFLLYNYVLYCVIPAEVLRGTKTAIVDLSTRTIGPHGAYLYSLLVALCAIGALNANVYATGRIYVTAADKGYLPAIFSTSRRHRGTSSGSVRQMRFYLLLPGPLLHLLGGDINQHAETRDQDVLNRSMITHLCISTIYIVGGTFDSLVTFLGISEYLFFCLSIAGILRIRHKHPKIVTYKTRLWYIGLFCAGSFCLVLQGIITAPLQGVAIATLVCLSWVIYQFMSIQ